MDAPIGERMRPAGLLRASKNGVQVTVFALVPALFLAAFLVIAITPGGHEAIDFRVFYNAAHAYLHGRSPYPLVPGSLTWAHGAQSSYVYPPLLAALLTPLTFLSYHLAVIVWVLLSAAAIAAALWLLEVRDWRCYGAVFLWPSTLAGISVGTLSPFLLLGLAAAWRFRDRTPAVAAAVAFVVTAKLFLWPVVGWLWLTGRRAAAVAAVAAGVMAAVTAWLWIGFAGIGSYAVMLRRLDAVESAHGYAAAWQLAGGVGLAVTAIGCAAVAYRVRGAERTAFAAAAIAALLLTPILWLHYLSLLAAALPRRFSALWLAPALLWLTPREGASGAGWRIALVTGVIAAVALAIRRSDDSAASHGAFWVRSEPAALSTPRVVSARPSLSRIIQ
ncbi:MAG TPA: glycosyltransferase 87 family protein [Gaiellaceae bacterium]|nr:glycosyltransferase 87 family protein [Gaiellaceae bacterium]